MQKLKIALIFGGKSGEHEVSIMSAKNVFEAMNKEKYEVHRIFIDKNGAWFTLDQDENKTKIDSEIAFLKSMDLAFPLLHGPYGEDGSIQGLFKFFDIPFVGCGILGSAIGMDKEITKKLLKEAGIKIADFLCFRSNENPNYEEVKAKLGEILFVKPANAGSSLGVSKVKNKDEFEKAIKTAFLHDSKILIESAIQGREVECAVLGTNQNPIASVAGEVITTSEFYSYDAKYMDANASRTEIPANLSEAQMQKIKESSIKIFKILECEGLSRIDFFLTEQNELILNEINTMPGFTSISMYPKLWEASGISYSELIDRLISLARNH